MKPLYPLLLLCACLSCLPAKAQNWRPFRPNGDVHAFRGAAPDTVLTMRLDSAAVNGADSVYYFNRIMRRASSFSWKKSVNNQFGQQMRYNVAQRTYVLFWNGGSVNGFSLDRALVLKPFVPVGTTWSSFFTDYGVTTKLLSRGTSLIDGVQDSIATFQVGASLTVVLSKHYGLVSAPKDLAFGLPAPQMLTLVRRPEAAGRSYYNPSELITLQPGDELGYKQEPIYYNTFMCYQGWLLTRTVSRQETADSLIYTFQQQRRTEYSAAPGCPGASVSVSPVRTIRLAASRRTGIWAANAQTNSVIKFNNVELLSYEYRPQSTSSILMGHPVVPGRSGAGCGGAAKLRQQMLYRTGNAINYQPGLDALAWESKMANGVGVASQYEHSLIYSRRNSQACGSRADFVTLLPVKRAQSVASLQLYPNPATTSATLLLPAPARAAATVRLLDGVGRAVLTQPLTAGQSTATLELQGLAAGLYLVEVQLPGEAPRHVRLQHQP
ncbi:T9SS type A sorting domain-containing protein [Hymenobacter algoricola]|uniref:Secretion system C-terminal sorting domain-containing protein n=1 Tax=Hymenobacter algoricola TaxID=486267 RepID=A0ABP7MRE6_9BACT